MNGYVFTREIAAGGLFVVVPTDAANEIIDVFGSSDPSAPAGPAAPSDELAGVLASVAQSALPLWRFIRITANPSGLNDLTTVRG